MQYGKYPALCRKFARLLAAALLCFCTVQSASALTWRKDAISIAATPSQPAQMLSVERAEIEIQKKSGSGRGITLPLVRLIPSASANTVATDTSAPLLFIPGGPGLSGIQHLQIPEFRTLLQALSASRVVLLYDPRGAGASTPSLLPSSAEMLRPDTLATRASFLAQLQRASDSVLKRLTDAGFNADAFSFAESVADVERIRSALGASKIDLLAHSFGSQVALAYAQLHTPNIGRMTLVSTRLAEYARKSPAEMDRFMLDVFKLAEADTIIAAKMPQLLPVLDRVLAKLDKQPISVEVSGRNGTETYQVGGYALRFMISMFFLNDPDNFSHLPKLLYELDTGSRPWGVVFNLGRMLRGGVSLGWFSNGASVAVPPAHFERITREAAASRMQDAMSFPFPDINPRWSATPATYRTDTAKLKDIPILFVGGTLDGITPLTHVEALQAQLPKAQVLRIINGGHQSLLRASGLTDSNQIFLTGKRVEGTFALPEVKFISLISPATGAR